MDLPTPINCEECVNGYSGMCKYATPCSICSTGKDISCLLCGGTGYQYVKDYIFSYCVICKSLRHDHLISCDKCDNVICKMHSFPFYDMFICDDHH